MKLKFPVIDERFNIPFSFSQIEKQFVVINYVGLKLGALKDGNILLVIWLKYSIGCNFLSYGALLLNFCICVTEEDVHIITQRKFRSELIRKSYSTQCVKTIIPKNNQSLKLTCSRGHCSGYFCFLKIYQSERIMFYSFWSHQGYCNSFIKNKEGTIVRFAFFTENLYYFVRIPKWALN